MMDDMVEQLARIAHAYIVGWILPPGRQPGWEGPEEHARYRMLARRILDAMREPTEDMKKAGAKVVYGITFDHRGTLGAERAEACYDAMIDAALK